MKVAVVQMTSGAGLDDNLRKIERWVEEAAREGVELVSFPEMAYLTCAREAWVKTLPSFDGLAEKFAALARRHRVHLLPGSIREPVPGVKDRCFNTAFLFSPEGKTLLKYRKIFLFKATLPDRVYDEAGYCDSGDTLVTAQVGEFKVGLSICYDVRFPELFRSLKKKGSELVFLPAAFTVPTGKAHWDCLTRARAIENAFFLAAPTQWGVNGDGARTYGYSRIVSPWGETLVDLPEGEGLLVADVRKEAIAAARARVDSWASRREDLLPIA